MSVSQEEQDRVLRQPFDIERHKQTFHNYLEVVIREDGTVEYAIPSHSETMLSLIMRKRGVSRDEAQKLCPPEYYFDFATWLCMESGCVSVWSDFCIGKPNDAQYAKLVELRDARLYRGIIPSPNAEAEQTGEEMLTTEKEL